MLGILQTFAVNQPLVLAQVKHSRHRVKDLSLYAGKISKSALPSHQVKVLTAILPARC